ncbi:unnamed protein product [Urochloa decumbens]|uniref:Uncharacterized protein n=1 Tax=Urochloa decumbens TaxID=240449 RepID=A0ABC9AXV4_9POAL
MVAMAAQVSNAAAAAMTWSPASSTATLVDAEKLRFIEEMTTNVDAAQERVLAEILSRNADAEYLATKCGLAGATDRATFRAKVPMVTYDDLAPYIRRIADGDRSPILSGSGHPISEFLTSSGTSGGERKLIPTVADELGRRHLLYSLVMPVMNQRVPGLDKGKGLYFLFVKSETKTPGGLPARTVLTSYYKSTHFRNHSTGDVYSNNTSPAAAITCDDAFQSAYAQLLCGLCQRRDVARVGAVFASGLLRVVRFFQRNWEQLAADVEAGALTNPRVTDSSVRAAVAGVLRRPDPELAEFIRAEGSSGDGSGIIARIWPNAKCLDTIVTGSMAQYVPTLNYYSGGLPVISDIYGSSECYFGINLRPMCDPYEVSYTIMPNMAYFEFLPMDGGGDGDDASQLVELAGVEAGREYELVVTNYAGLCRYRVGDVLRVTGFHNAAPEFRYVRRRNVLLSVVGADEKTDEAFLQRAVERASSALLLRTHGGAAVLDFTSRACTATVPGHYVVYWELLLMTKSNKGDEGAVATVDGETLELCCLEMEEAMNAVYRQCRVADGSIGPLEIRVVRPGTFEELMDYAISRGSSVGQYKAPRCVAAASMIELLDSRVVSNHFSPKLPHWSPGERASN